MRAFACGNCGQLLFFENSICLRCGTPLGFVDSQLELIALSDPDGNGDGLRRCANSVVATCNWMLSQADPEVLCGSCRLTRTRPADGDAPALAAFAQAESTKRRLLFQLLDLGLPVAEGGLAFDLLSSAVEPVSTGHEDGLITIDLAESDDVRREQRRTELGEPYRTMLGHFRHEVAHYYWPLLVERDAVSLDRCRALFGDERADYGAAQERHYASGPPADWAQTHVSAYATMHPWEDWAETFAHYLHIRDTLQTAGAFGLLVAGPEPLADPALTSVPEVDAGDREPIESVIDAWLPLTYALNAVNRSMGLGDLYPFTLAPVVIDKLGYVHERVLSAAAAAAAAGWRP